jgi:hypothetical protein
MSGFFMSNWSATIHSSIFDRLFDFDRGGYYTLRILWLTRCEVEGITVIARLAPITGV